VRVCACCAWSGLMWFRLVWSGGKSKSSEMPRRWIDSISSCRHGAASQHLPARAYPYGHKPPCRPREHWACSFPGRWAGRRHEGGCGCHAAGWGCDLQDLSPLSPECSVHPDRQATAELRATTSVCMFCARSSPPLGHGDGDEHHAVAAAEPASRAQAGSSTDYIHNYIPSASASMHMHVLCPGSDRNRKTEPNALSYPGGRIARGSL